MRSMIFVSALALSGCAALSTEFDMDEMPVTDMSVPAVMASVETAPVQSSDDAADDPAVLVLAGADPVILGTDKRAGLYVYNLDGTIRQFLPVGKVNNVDVRLVADDAAIAVASNRSYDTVSVFASGVEGTAEMGSFPVIRTEPYGICMGLVGGRVVTAVTHKGGEVDLYRLNADDVAASAHYQTVELGAQLEGCVFDETNGRFIVGREEVGVFAFDLDMATGLLSNEQAIDLIGGATGIVSDIEGISLYDAGEGEGYIVASSQGNNTYAVYDRQSGDFLGRFRIEDNAADGIDGTEETDGLDVYSGALPGYPKGVLVVQDGFNFPAGEAQNFKVIDWRDIEAALGL